MLLYYSSAWMKLSALLSIAMLSPSEGMILDTLQKTEEQYRNSIDILRVGNVDVLDKDLAVCRVIDMNRYSIIVHDDRRIPFPFPFPRQAAAAIALAMEHLNSGNAEIVSELDGLNNTCKIRFLPEFLDTAGDARQMIRPLNEVLSRDLYQPCAFVGAFFSAVTIATSILTESAGYPQVTALSKSPELNDKSRFPLLGRVVPSADQYGSPLLHFLYSHWSIRHMGVFHSSDEVGLAYLSGLQTAATQEFKDLHLYPISFTFPANGDLDAEDLASRISLLKDTEVRIFLLVGGPRHQQKILREAYRQGIAGTGVHNWVLSDELFAYEDEHLPSSLEASVIPGLVKYTPVLSKSGVGRYDAFHSTWKSLASSSMDLAFLNDKLPQHKDATFRNAMASSDFEAMLPYVPLFYDATVLIGLSACSAASDMGLTGQEHFNAILDTGFVGASGPLKLATTTGSRLSEKSMFVVSTHIPVNHENGNLSFVAREVADYEDGKWTVGGDNFFNDKTPNVPLALRPLETEHDGIGGNLRATGLTLSFVVMLTAAAAVVWAFVNRASRVVKASQPLFLHLICFVPLTIDDSVVENPSFACLAYPILMALGWCFALTALYCKTRLVNKIFHKPAFTALKIRKADIISPMALLLGVNIAILVLWAIYAPFRWVRKPIARDRFDRNIETVGVCECLGTQNLYWIALAVVNFGVLIFTLQQAFVARKIATEFAESEFILQAMSIILVVSFVACPVMVMVHREPKAFYFVRIAHSFVISLSLNLFLFVPKVFFLQKFGDDAYKKAVTDSLRRLEGMGPRQSGRAIFSEEGPLVLDHPKLRIQELSVFDRLMTRNRELELELAELRPPPEQGQPSEESQQPRSASAGENLAFDSSEVSQRSEALRQYLRSLYG